MKRVRHMFGCLVLAGALTLRATPANVPAGPLPMGLEEWAALKSRDASRILGELQAGQEERPSVLVPLMVVGLIAVVVWSVAGDDEREQVTFETLNLDKED